jgi:hypothetical protein
LSIHLHRLPRCARLQDGGENAFEQGGWLARSGIGVQASIAVYPH